MQRASRCVKEYDRLEEQYAEADELPDEVEQRLGKIETALAAFENPPVRYDPSEIARAGVFVSIDRDGELLIERGFVRPEDAAPVTPTPTSSRADAEDNDEGVPNRPRRRCSALSSASALNAESEDSEDDAIKPLPDRLVTELTAYRTLALRDALANNPHVALTALLHTLCLRPLRTQLLGRLSAGVGPRCLLPDPGAGSEGQSACQGDCRAAGGLESRHARGRGRAVGLARAASTTRAAWRSSPIASRTASTRCRRRPTATAPVSRQAASSDASRRPIGSRVPYRSTWWRLAGAPRSRIISAVCQKSGSSRRCARRRESSRPSSSII